MVMQESVDDWNDTGAGAGADRRQPSESQGRKVAMSAKTKIDVGTDRPFHQTYTNDTNENSVVPSMIQFFALIACAALSAYAIVSDASAGSGLKPK